MIVCSLRSLLGFSPRGSRIACFTGLLIAASLQPGYAQSFDLFKPLTGVAASQNIQSIEVEGLYRVDEGVVRSRLDLAVGKAYSQTDLAARTRDAIESLYATSLFRDVRIETEQGTSGKRIFVVVQEKPTLSAVELKGNKELDSAALYDAMTLRRGQAYDQADLERTRQKILRKYRADGFLMAQVRIEEEPTDSLESDVTFRIDEGRKVVVTDIQVNGNQRVETEELIKGLASKIDRWYSSGEFKQENLASDKDSLLAVLKHHGFLDARVLESTADYLPDSTYRFYNGSAAKNPERISELLDLVNAELSRKDSPLAQVASQGVNSVSPLGRRFPDATTPVVQVRSEDELVDLLNRILDRRALRRAYLKEKGADVVKSEAVERKEVRLSLESKFPLSVHADQTITDRVRLKYAVEEGRRYYMGRFVFDGNEVFPSLALGAQVLLDSNKIFDNRKFEQTMKSIQDMYREEGYIFLRLEDRRSYRDSIVDLTFVVNEGKPAQIRAVQIAGNTTTHDRVIRREIKLFPGDIFRQSLMERSFRDIMQLNFFDNVKPDLKVVGEQDVDLIFDVEEKKAGTGQFSAGASFNAQDGITGNLAISIPNCCIGEGRQANAQIEFGPYKRVLSAGFSEPWFLDRPTTLGVSGNWSNYTDQYGRFSDITRYGGRVYAGRRLKWPDDFFYVQADVSWQWNQQSGQDYGFVKFTGEERALGFSITRDDKNLPIFPTDGSRVSYNFEYVGLGGDFQYTRNEVNLKWWFPLIGNTVSVGLENQLGVLHGDALQYRTLYQMGGALGYNGKLRGFSAGSVGYGQLGRSFVSSTAELVYTIVPGQFYLLPAFYDAGNVFGGEISDARRGVDRLPNPWREIDLNNLRQDVGAGFRVVVPMMGIMGFDFAWPLGNEYAGQGMQTNFIISQGF